MTKTSQTVREVQNHVERKIQVYEALHLRDYLWERIDLLFETLRNLSDRRRGKYQGRRSILLSDLECR